MSWIHEKSEYTFFQKACMFCLRKGVIPNHVAIIMDGNRRYARKNSINKIEGHKFGFEKLAETLKWCRDLNIQEVSVFAFSIHNFSRENEEVTYLMNMIREKFQRLIDEKDLLVKYNVCVRIIGNLSLLSPDIQHIAKNVIKLTSTHTKFYLNICMAYTSHDEIRHSLNHIKWGIDNNLLDKEDITEDLIDKCMYMRNSPKVDLMIRTSGEARLSDFLMWQTENTCVRFFDAFWPEFSIWNLFGAILKYQTNYLLSVRVNDFHKIRNSEFNTDGECKNSRVSQFLLQLEIKFNDWLYNGSGEYFVKDE